MCVVVGGGGGCPHISHGMKSVNFSQHTEKILKILELNCVGEREREKEIERDRV